MCLYFIVTLSWSLRTLFFLSWCLYFFIILVVISFNMNRHQRRKNMPQRIYIMLQNFKKLFSVFWQIGWEWCLTRSNWLQGRLGKLVILELEILKNAYNVHMDKQFRFIIILTITNSSYCHKLLQAISKLVWWIKEKREL